MSTHRAPRRWLLARAAPLALLASLALGGCDDEASAPDGGERLDAAPAQDGSPSADRAVLPGRISVEPAIINLLAPVGEASSASLTVRNRGEGPLTLTALGFEVEAPGFDVEAAPPLPVTLAPGDEQVARIRFRPTGEAPTSARIVLRSDDPEQPELALPVNGRSPRRCLQVMPGSLDLGQVEVGQSTARFRVTVANCGDLPFTLGRLGLEGDPGYQLETADGTPAEGRVLEGGGVVALQVWYQSQAIRPGERATGNLRIEPDAADLRPVIVGLTVRGVGRQGCGLRLDPPRIEFGDVRVEATATAPLTLINDGTGGCGLRGFTVETPGGSFGVRDTPPADFELAGGARLDVTVTYTPRQPTPVGERTNLFVNYRDLAFEENRRTQAILFGVGAEALMGADPFDGLDLGEATAPDACGSEVKTVRVGNVGFVPLTLEGWTFEDDGGEACGRFVQVSAPEIPAGGLLLEAMQMVPLRFQYQPQAVGREECSLVVASDAQNNTRLRVRLSGEGVAEAATRQTFRMGEIRADQTARFTLRRRALADSVAVQVDGMESRAARFDVERNAVEFRPGSHPARGAEIQVDYAAACLPLEPPGG